MGAFPAAFPLFADYGDIDMYDKTLIAHLLPPEMIIKNLMLIDLTQHTTRCSDGSG